MTPKRCLVLGGSGYVGSAICKSLLDAGAEVAFTYHRTTAAADRRGSIRADLSVERDVIAAVDTASSMLGGLDVLIHAAGVSIEGKGPQGRAPTMGGPQRSPQTPPAREASVLLSLEAEEWDMAFAVNVRSAFLAARRFITTFDPQRGGEIIAIGSLDVVKPVASPAHHAASKAALHGLVVALAKELGPANVRANMVAPGLLGGGVSRAIPDDLKREYLKHTGPKRFGTPEEIAALVRFLALHNTYLTGQTLLADGGV